MNELVVVAKKQYTLYESVIAAFCIICGTIITRYWIKAPLGPWYTVTFALLVTFTLYMFKRRSVVLGRTHILMLVLCGIFNLVVLIFDNSCVKLLAELYSSFLFVYTVNSASSGAPMFDGNPLHKAMAAFFCIPFRCFGDSPRAIGSALSGRKSASNVKYILLGLVTAIPITIICGALLIKADDNFASLLSGFGNSFVPNTLEFALQIAFGIPLGFFFFGMMYANSSGYAQQGQKPAHYCVPQLVFCTAITPVCLLYITFFFCQLQYFTAAFGGTLPADFTYSGYARQGFFELFAVSLINFIIIVIINSYTSRPEGKKPISLRVFTIILSSMTLLLIATALSKMLLYINNYGLTKLRVYTSWFMILLAFIFVVVIISAVVTKLKPQKAVFAGFSLLLALLCFCNVDALIAGYNVNAYRSGQIEELDMEALTGLSADAITTVLPILGEVNAVDRSYYLNQKNNDSFVVFGNFSISRFNAYSEFNRYIAQ